MRVELNPGSPDAPLFGKYIAAVSHHPAACSDKPFHR